METETARKMRWVLVNELVSLFTVGAPFNWQTAGHGDVQEEEEEKLVLWRRCARRVSPGQRLQSVEHGKEDEYERFMEDVGDLLTQ